MVILLSFGNCDYLDIGGLFHSSNVNKRYDENKNLPAINPPLVPDVNNFCFLVFSDTHYYKSRPNNISKIINMPEMSDISFIIITGDITQAGAASSYQIAIDDFSNTVLPIYYVIGNHDLYHDGYSYFKKNFGRTIYDFVIGNTQFIILDTANSTLGVKQTKWLKNKFKDTNYENILLFSHYSLFNKEWTTFCEWSIPEERYSLIDLFDRYNVDYFFSGHLHYKLEVTTRDVKYLTIEAIYENEEPPLVKVTVNGNAVTHRFYNF